MDLKHLNGNVYCINRQFIKLLQLALCTAALLPELKPAPFFLSAIIGQA